MIRNYFNFIQKNWLTLFVGVIAFRVILTKISTYVVYRLAWYVTGSVAGRYYIGSPYGYDLIDWNARLKAMAYGIYGVAFIVEVIFIHIILQSKYRHHKFIYPVAGVAFFLSFPALTSWSIEVPCERVDVFGFGCARSIELIAPIGLSSSPLHIIPSAVAALICMKLYGKYLQHHSTYKINS